ncbi:endonuclease Q family protein [Patescibacteria group bacterium]|nr:endonuclease Q family protein [Patescibacteria group bacterium]MBU4512805.1 endonuclease Q family protein [Patescibacteria group bacterium]MCG2688132.1 endonuclease Q family protein [Candidatus Parcubacteria bacterium]
MKFVADFHIHSRFSRATSREINLVNLAKWAKIKGIDILGTGDFTHPLWFKELKEGLKPAENGLYQLRGGDDKTRFILTSEISCIYSKSGKVRKIHLIVFAPNLEDVERINSRLEHIGNIKSDGRPILGIDAKELLKIILEVSPSSFMVPAHAYTPWFSIFGSKSGFNSVEECFEDYSKYIFALETGLSADPKMCWRLSGLDKYTLISNSDAHSLKKLGREANVFEGSSISYQQIIDALQKSNQDLKLAYTIEFFPEEGKYHYDGHRSCNIVFSPSQTKKNNNICPVCNRPLTIGVLNRVDELADRSERQMPAGAIPFKSLVPLQEIIAEALGVSSLSKRVEQEYWDMIDKLGSEFNILLEVSKKELEASALPEIARGILAVREGRVVAEPGYDGVYGKIKTLGMEDQKTVFKQKSLF